MLSPEQLAAAYKRAKADGNIEAANELATLLNASVASSGSISTDFSNFQAKRRSAERESTRRTGASLALGPGGGAMAQGISQTPAEQSFNTGIARYLPAIAGSIAAPYLAPAMNATLAASLGGGIGALTSGKALDLPPNEMIADTVLAMTPLRAGGGWRVGAQNAVSGYATGTVADAMQTGEFNPASSQGMMGAGMPTAMEAVAGVGRTISRGRAAAESIKNARGTNALLAEALPEYGALESKVFHDGSNEILNRALKEADMGIAQLIKQRFPSIPDTSLMTGRLSMEIGRLEVARKNAATLAARAQRMEAELAQSRELGRAVRPEQVRAAQEAALEATNASFVAREGLEALFNGNSPKFGGTGAGARMERIEAVTKVADDSVTRSLGDLYKAAGINENDIVVTLADTKEFFRNAARRGEGLEGNAAREKVEELVRSAFDEQGNLTLEKFKALRGRIAKELDGDAAFSNDASRIAGAAYDVVSSAAGKTMSRTMPEKYTNWLDAQAFAAENFRVRDVGIVQAMRNGDSEELISKILKEGRGKATGEIDDYADLIAKQFPEAAEAFRRETNRVIRDGVIDLAMNRTLDAPALNTIDAGKLAQTLTKMRNNGFDIADIGFGDKDLVSALSRLSQGKNKQGWSIETISQLADDVSSLGVSKAVAKARYARELRNYAIQNGLPAARRRAAFQARNTQGARVSAQDAFAEVRKLEEDDFIKLMEDGNMRLSKDFSSNAKWVDKLLTLEPASVTKIMGTLRSSGRGADADLIASTAMAKMFRGILSGTEDGLQINRRAIQKAFLEDGSDGAMNSLQAMIGNEGFSELKRNLIDPLKRLYKTMDEMVSGPGGGMIVKPFTRVGANNARFILPIEPIIRWMRAGRYNLLYKAVVDPRYARHAKAAGYVLENIKDPATRTALLTYARQDEPNAAP